MVERNTDSVWLSLVVSSVGGCLPSAGRDIFDAEPILDNRYRCNMFRLIVQREGAQAQSLPLHVAVGTEQDLSLLRQLDQCPMGKLERVLRAQLGNGAPHDVHVIQQPWGKGRVGVWEAVNVTIRARVGVLGRVGEGTGDMLEFGQGEHQ